MYKSTEESNDGKRTQQGRQRPLTRIVRGKTGKDQNCGETMLCALVSMYRGAMFRLSESPFLL